MRAALDQLQWLATHLRTAYPQHGVGFDLSDMSGYAYYSGGRFAVYAAGASDALARGGRYDEVGAAFGRSRPAVGFSLDLKALAELARPHEAEAAIRAPWSEDLSLRASVRRLRDQGHTVLSALPGDGASQDDVGAAFNIDRELVAVAGQWVLRAVDAAAH